MTPLHQEWLALQAQHERYEGLALAVKLAAIAVTLVAVDMALCTALLGLLWLQEAVLKTFQGRLADRLIVVETALKPGHNAPEMQLHSDWLRQRPRGAQLALQYVKSAVRPTVALPYPALMLLAALR